MSSDFTAWAGRVQQLRAAVAALGPVADLVGAPPPDGEEWFELLERKLVPQVAGPALLVAAVVGGTNIGKSSIFNHLAGETASGTSPLAAGTKHPVCLVPEAVADEALLSRLFPGFHLAPWRSSEDPLAAAAEDHLFWRTSAAVPPKLLLLDTPDIDSDAHVNWDRADHIRQSADLLIAVLTQQKYNDAAVKRFFRKAVEADKPIVVIFNQCDLVEDRPFWHHWLATFTSETGARPRLVYVVPYDRVAARDLALPFFPLDLDPKRPLGPPASLQDELARLHFDEIKIQTLAGAFAKVTDARTGLPCYLGRIKAASGQFSAAAKALGAEDLARVQWPALPVRVLVDEIRGWWDVHRKPWSRTVHGVYRTVGQGLTWPMRTAWTAVRGPQADPLDVFRAAEREAIVVAVGRLFDELERLGKLGNETLKPRLAELLKGDSRRELLNRVQSAHAELSPVGDDYRAFLRTELDAWAHASPRVVGFLRSLDHAAAIARPAITVTLAVSGWILAGGIVHEAAAHAAGHTAAQLATEAALTGGFTGGGEVLVATTGESVSRAAARLFRRLQNRYAELRAGWLADWLERELFGDLMADLKRGAEVPASLAFQAAEGLVDQ